MKEEQAMDEQLLKLKREIREMIRLDYIVPEDIPAIELYMDQVTSFMDKQLSGNKRDEKDMVLTKTMINNYTKNRLLPPPEKKRYSKEHIILLIYIYYLKNVLPIGDIQTILAPMSGGAFDEAKMSEIYDSIYELEKPQYFNIEASAAKAAALVEKKFPRGEDEYLSKMAFIYLLGYDMFSKKRLIEKLIDELPPYNGKAARASKEVKKTRKPAARKTATARKAATHKAGTGKTAARKPAGKAVSKTATKTAAKAASKTAVKSTGRSAARKTGDQ